MALTFGDSDWIDFGDTTILDGATLICGHARVKISDLTADHTVYEKISGFGNGFVLFMDDVGPARTDSWTIFLAENDHQIRVEGATGSAVVGAYQAVGWSYIQGDANGLRLYIDGVEDANSPASTAALAAFPNVALPLVIGRHDAGADRYFAGDLGPIALWVGATLTTNDFKALAAGIPAQRIRPEFLKFHSILDGSSSENDFSPTGLTGTVNGTIPIAAGPPIQPPFGYDIDWPPAVVAAAPGVGPHNPLGHPLYGPFAGPIAA